MSQICAVILNVILADWNALSEAPFNLLLSLTSRPLLRRLSTSNNFTFKWIGEELPLKQLKFIIKSPFRQLCNRRLLLQLEVLNWLPSELRAMAFCNRSAKLWRRQIKSGSEAHFIVRNELQLHSTKNYHNFRKLDLSMSKKRRWYRSQWTPTPTQLWW